MNKLLVTVVMMGFLVVCGVYAGAAELTVKNTDVTLTGGISASYNYNSDARDSDYFNVDTSVVHLLKNPTLDSPVGGHLAFGGFDVKTPTGQHVSPTLGGENFRLWLGNFSYMPVDKLTVDAGLLWHKFGEAPITIVNQNVTRPVAFLAQPVCFGGARVGYDAGNAKVYAGMNDGSGLGAGHGNKDEVVDADGDGVLDDSERALEVGASATLAEVANVAVNYFDHDEGYDTINGSIGVEQGMFNAKIEANLVSSDTPNAGKTEDSAKTYALYMGCKFSDNFKLPVRLELVDDNESDIYHGYDGWNIAITPTFNPTQNSFIRFEGVYASDDNKVFADSDGVANMEDTRCSLIAEFGFIL